MHGQDLGLAKYLLPKVSKFIEDFSLRWISLSSECYNGENCFSLFTSFLVSHFVQWAVKVQSNVASFTYEKEKRRKTTKKEHTRERNLCCLLSSGT
jgi:hypothetical protein